MIEIKNICLFAAFESGLMEAAAHQCNCQKTFGSGVALEVKKRYPEVYQADKDFGVSSNPELYQMDAKIILGRISYAKTYFGTFYNIYGQLTYGKGRRHTNYEAFFTGLERVREEMVSRGQKSLGIPFKIGSDRGGADWSIIYAMIVSIFTDSGIDILICKK